jgi:MFS-type transporter involved in bile tolerance (Atg22 family)
MNLVSDNEDDAELHLDFVDVCAGLFKHSQELSRAYLGDITPRSQHSRVYGHFNSMSNIGFIIGPIIGGHIVDGLGGFNAVALATAASFLVNLRE